MGSISARILSTCFMVMCVVWLLDTREAQAREDGRKVSKDECTVSDDIESEKAKFISSLRLAEAEINKCCAERCTFRFTQNQLDILTNFAILVASGIVAIATKRPVIAGAATIGGAGFQLAGGFAKIYGSSEALCSSEKKNQMLIGMRIAYEKIKNLKKKDLVRICKDAVKNDVHANTLPEQINLAHRMLNEGNESGSLSQALDDLSPDCNQVSLEKASSLECSAAIYRFCALKGFIGGIAQEVPTHSIYSICIPSTTALLQTTDFETLKRTDPACQDKSAVRTGVCMAAFRDVCRKAGYSAAVLQDVDEGSVSLLCIRAQMEKIALAELTKKVPRCNSIDMYVHPFCTSAAHAYCESLGYSGGTIQQKCSEGEVLLACVAGTPQKIEWSERVSPYIDEAQRNRAKILLREAKTMMALGEDEKAEQKTLEAIKIVPDDADAWYGLGVAYARQRKRREAIDAFNKWIDLNKDKPSHYLEGTRVMVKGLGGTPH